MPICDMCSTEVEDIFECKECGMQCCEFCGDKDKKLCDVCKQHSKGGSSEDENEEFEEESEDEEEY
ncbi:Uncharacterised protein [Candidatus Tiddalikarchaeum anstoanum]|nr:Uncharacterised protein [Candidatus Tiddalikarchaeum anstoanum]